MCRLAALSAKKSITSIPLGRARSKMLLDYKTQKTSNNLKKSTFLTLTPKP